ncbi:hypothetical protein HK097_005844 [Rhizophlyctis rosea]|uniref:Uncharacterized protein n=1 Tax=Rhizophlyctis rosea TaxID=64517 RepID=A0AAD5WW25_9FUNG|nr:hypothetical protein HK097_005844 [Rhizophlyctis rosea]
MIRVIMQTLHMLGVIEHGGYDDDGVGAATAPPVIVPAWMSAAIPDAPEWVRDVGWGGQWAWERWCRVLLWMADGDVRKRWKGGAWKAVEWGAVIGVVFFCLLLIKIILGKKLLQMSRARVTQLHREHALLHPHHTHSQQSHQPSSSSTYDNSNMRTRPSMEWASEAELERKWGKSSGGNTGSGIGRVERVVPQPGVIYWDQEKSEKRRENKDKDEGVEDEGKSAAKLDSIDRFQMVRSRIV